MSRNATDGASPVVERKAEGSTKRRSEAAPVLTVPYLHSKRKGACFKWRDKSEIGSVSAEENGGDGDFHGDGLAQEWRVAVLLQVSASTAILAPF